MDEEIFHLIGDKMPNNNQVHLPSWETQKDINFMSATRLTWKYKKFQRKKGWR